jgi:hypothetical protein
MRLADRLFLDHPRQQGETYLEHARFAAAVGSRMVLGGLACLAHAAAPALFPTTGSRTVWALAARLESRGARAARGGSRDPDGRAAPVGG